MSDLEKYLNRIKNLDAIISRKQDEYDMWFQMAQGMGGGGYGERVQSSGSKQKMEYAVARYIDAEKEIVGLMKEKTDFIQKIAQLEFSECEILFMIYIQGYTLKDVQKEKDKSYSWVTMKHRKAKDSLEGLVIKRGKD